MELELTITGDGIMGHLIGGEKPHLGAVVLCVPRPSLSNEEKRGSNSWVIPLLGHKDDEVTKPVAELIAISTGQPVSLAAGIHIDQATGDDIKHLIENCNLAAQKFLEAYNQDT